MSFLVVSFYYQNDPLENLNINMS